MIRKIIHIDEDKCNGCGLCATACHEGAIDIIDGKARLVREHFCDGFGDCLPNCPMGAITFEEREAPAYDEAAVKEAQRAKVSAACEHAGAATNTRHAEDRNMEGMQLTEEQKRMMEEMGHHPGGGCPKLDEGDYTDKLTEIISNNDIKSVTIVRMEVPCCGGLERAAENALRASGKFIPWQVVTISRDGRILE